MSNVLQLAIALGFPVVLLIGVMWLERLEDNLPAKVQAARRRPDPAPILAMPVHAPLPIHLPAHAPVRDAEVPAVASAPVTAPETQPEPVVAGRVVPEQRQPEPAPAALRVSPT